MEKKVTLNQLSEVERREGKKIKTPSFQVDYYLSACVTTSMYVNTRWSNVEIPGVNIPVRTSTASRSE